MCGSDFHRVQRHHVGYGLKKFSMSVLKLRRVRSSTEGMQDGQGRFHIGWKRSESSMLLWYGPVVDSNGWEALLRTFFLQMRTIRSCLIDAYLCQCFASGRMEDLKVRFSWGTPQSVRQRRGGKRNWREKVQIGWEFPYEIMLSHGLEG